jgi:hypothetical protein
LLSRPCNGAVGATGEAAAIRWTANPSSRQSSSDLREARLHLVTLAKGARPGTRLASVRTKDAAFSIREIDAHAVERDRARIEVDAQAAEWQCKAHRPTKFDPDENGVAKTVFLVSDRNSRTPMTVKCVYFEPNENAWRVLARWHTDLGDMIDDAFTQQSFVLRWSALSAARVRRKSFSLRIGNDQGSPS